MAKNKLRVLIVEDSRVTRDFISATVENGLGGEVVKAENGLRALKLIPSMGPFDLMIFDINMPDVNGIELIKFVRSTEHLSNVPIIVISTEGRQRDIQKGYEAGANDYIVKPFDPDDLIRRAKKLLKIKA